MTNAKDSSNRRNLRKLLDHFKEEQVALREKEFQAKLAFENATTALSDAANKENECYLILTEASTKYREIRALIKDIESI